MQLETTNFGQIAYLHSICAQCQLSVHILSHLPKLPQPSQIMKNGNIGEVVYEKVRLVLKSVSTLRTGAGISRPPFLLPRSSLPSSSLSLMVRRSHQMTYGQHGYVTYDIGLFRS